MATRDPAKLKAGRARYHAKHREKRRAQSRAWKAKNRDKVLAAKKRYRDGVKGRAAIRAYLKKNAKTISAKAEVARRALRYPMHRKAARLVLINRWRRRVLRVRFAPLLKERRRFLARMWTIKNRKRTAERCRIEYRAKGNQRSPLRRLQAAAYNALVELEVIKPVPGRARIHRAHHRAAYEAMKELGLLPTLTKEDHHGRQVAA